MRTMRRTNGGLREVAAGRKRYRRVVDESSIAVSDEPAANRYVARLGAEIVGFVEYRRIGGRIVFLHTKVPPAFEGQGIASLLARHVLDAARNEGIRASIKCPYLRAFVERHPEYDPSAGEPPLRPPAAG